MNLRIAPELSERVYFIARRDGLTGPEYVRRVLERVLNGTEAKDLGGRVRDLEGRVDRLEAMAHGVQG